MSPCCPPEATEPALPSALLETRLRPWRRGTSAGEPPCVAVRASVRCFVLPPGAVAQQRIRGRHQPRALPWAVRNSRTMAEAPPQPLLCIARRSDLPPVRTPHMWAETPHPARRSTRLPTGHVEVTPSARRHDSTRLEPRFRLLVLLHCLAWRLQHYNGSRDGRR